MMTRMGWTLPMSVLLGLGVGACGGKTIHRVVTSTVPVAVVETTTTMKVVSSPPTSATSPTSIAAPTTTWQPLTLTQAEAIAVEVDHHGGEAYRILGRAGTVTPEGLSELELAYGRRQLDLERRLFESSASGPFKNVADVHQNVRSLFEQSPNCLSVVVDDVPGDTRTKPGLQLFELTDRWRLALNVPATKVKIGQKGIECALLSVPAPPLS